MDQNTFLPILVGVLLIGASALADDAISTDRTQSDIAEIKQQMAAMEARHDSEIAALRNANGDKWLTEARAVEIREMVKDVLADSQTRTSLQSSDVTAGWNKGFFLTSADGNFKLVVDGQIQTRFAYNYQAKSSRNPTTIPTTQPSEASSSVYGFEMRRVKLRFSGNVLDPSWTYRIVLSFKQNPLGTGASSTTNGAVLTDAEIRKDFGNGFAVRTGQWKGNYNFEEFTSSTAQQFADRTLVNQYFSTGHIQGVELQYGTADWRASINYNDGGSNRNIAAIGSGSSLSNNQVQWATAGRVDWKLMGDWKQFKNLMSFRGSDNGLQLGAAYNWQRGGALNPLNPAFVGNSDGMNISYTADFNARFNGASIFAAFLGNSFYSRPDGAASVNSYGVVVQGGYFLNDDVELIGRWEWLNVSGGTTAVVGSGSTSVPATSNSATGSAINAQHFQIYTVGANYYISKNSIKLTADTGYVVGAILFANGLYNQSIIGADYRTDQNSSATGQFVARVQLQLLF